MASDKVQPIMPTPAERAAREARARHLFLQEGMTKADVARELGVSQASVHRYLAGLHNGNTDHVRGTAEARRNPNNNEAKAAERVEQAFELRLTGLTYTGIGRQMGVTADRARQFVEAAIAQRIQPKARELREIEVARLDRYLEKLDPEIEAGNPKAIAQALRVAERRARLLGLDSPVQIEMQVHEKTQADLELEEMVREAQARNAMLRAEITAGADDDPDPGA